MWGLIAASMVVVLGTVPNKAPKLNGLPWIGATRPLVTFKVNGSPPLVVRLARPDPSRLKRRAPSSSKPVDNPVPNDRPEPRTAQIEVGVYDPSSFERIDRALVNFLLPVAACFAGRRTPSGARKEADGDGCQPRIGSRDERGV